MELELRPEDVAGQTFYYGKGCENCNNTGYKGRQGIYEIMMLDDEMRDMIVKHASTQVLRIEAKKRGMRTLRQSGLLAIYDGVDDHRRGRPRDDHGRGMTGDRASQRCKTRNGADRWSAPFHPFILPTRRCTV